MACITDEPHRGAICDLRLLQQPGLETFRQLIHGDLPGPPIWRLTGMHPTEAGLGKATFSMPVTSWLADGNGVYWGGLFALFADSPLASAIWTTQPAGRVPSTSELNMCFVRPMNDTTRNIVGRAETVHSGSQVGLSTIEITDQDGRMLSFGSTRCLLSDYPKKPGEKQEAPDLGPTDPPDPYLRQPPPSDYSRDEVASAIPIDLQRITIAENRVLPIWELTGYRLREVADGYAKCTLPSSPWFSNGTLSIYGGLLAWAAEFTMGAAVYSTLPAGDIFTALDMHIRFTRPATINSGDLTLEGHVHHRGRQLRVSSCCIDSAQGKRVAMATGSALILPGGARLLSEGKKPDEIVSILTANNPPYTR